MGDCGCGCGGAGNCNDNLDTLAKNAQLSGNIKYDGGNFDCSDDDLDVNTNEGLNSILQKLLAKACSVGNGGNYLAYQEVNLDLDAASADRIFDFYFPENVVKYGEGIRVKLAMQFQSITDPSGIQINVAKLGKNDSIPTTTESVQSVYNIPTATLADRIVVEYTYFLDKAGDDTIGYSIEVETGLGGIQYIEAQTSGVPPFATFIQQGIGVDVILLGSDTAQLRYVSVEHLR